MKVEFAWYGTTSNRDKSGAYLFLPDGDAKVKLLFAQRFWSCSNLKPPANTT